MEKLTTSKRSSPEQWQRMGCARDQQILKLKKENEAIQAKMVKLEANRKQLQADLKEERKLQAELVRKVQLMSRLNDSLISQKSVSTVDTSVQANYLAVAPDFLCGMEVHGETVLEVVGDKPQKLLWPGYGFYLEVPDGALTPGVTASVGVMMILPGQFRLPENTQLISAIYWISSNEVFLKKVAINIQHCAVITTKEQCSKFRFVVAKCSQKVLPYTFKEREGLFNIHTPYAAIKVKQFSVFAAIAPDGTELCYTGLVFYKPIPRALSVDFVFVIVCNLEPHLQSVKQDYSKYKEDKLRQLIEFEEDAVELDLPIDPPAIVDHWRILPLTYPKIVKVAIQQFQPGRHLPACNIEIEWIGEGQQQLFSHRVVMKGAKKPNNFFQMRFHPQSIIGDTAPSSSQVRSTTSQGAVERLSPVVASNSRPTMSEIISMQKRDGSKGKLMIIDWIASHELTQCVDFAHKLLVDALPVKQLSIVHEEKEQFVCAVLQKWLDRDDDDKSEESLPCTWDALVICCEDANLDGVFVKLLRDNIPK